MLRNESIARARPVGSTTFVGHNGLVDETTLDTVDVDAIARRVRPVLESDARVRFANLYGSLARGDARTDSDVDLAVPTTTAVSPLFGSERAVGCSAVVDRDRVDQLPVNLARYVRIRRDLAEIPLAE